MSLKTLTFRAPEEKVAALDSIAAMQQRDRSFILNEAVDHYLSIEEYNLALIDQGIREDDAGDMIDHSEIKKMVASWARKSKR